MIANKLDSLNEGSKEPIKEVLTDKKILIIRASFTKDLKYKAHIPSPKQGKLF